MKCNECGTIAPEDDLFCGECGAVLPASTPDETETAAEAVARAQPETPPSPAAAKRDPRANAAFVFGIVAIAMAVISCVPILGFVTCLGPVAGITAIILGALAKRDIDAREGSEQDRAKAQQGLVLGIVGTILYFVVFGMSMILGIGLGILGEM